MIEGRDFSAASTIGARKEQQDEWATHVDPPPEHDNVHLLAAVADGMGGMPAGGTASRLALAAFLDSYTAIRRPTRERLHHALAHANRAVGIAVEAEPSLTGMGCTLVAALFFEDRCQWLSVGDSLLLCCRRGEITRVNPLHVYANELAEMRRRGEITAQQATNHPDRSALTSAIQGTVVDEVAEGEFHLESDDIVLLATDGIVTLSEEELTSMCANHAKDDAAVVAELAIERINALAREGQDNATIVVVRRTASKSASVAPARSISKSSGHRVAEASEPEPQQRDLKHKEKSS